jgi:hypothetical protein
MFRFIGSRDEFEAEMRTGIAARNYGMAAEGLPI